MDNIKDSEFLEDPLKGYALNKYQVYIINHPKDTVYKDFEDYYLKNKDKFSKEVKDQAEQSEKEKAWKVDGKPMNEYLEENKIKFK
ncbi:MAG: hypothetical protein NTW62_00955 [Candidatus Nomurabacteria bacterium]|nr:hypothetical protein [Candidatus Nomurabacteria bacterium]